MGEHAVFSEGQKVWVKDFESIAATMDDSAKLAGLVFMPEMARYCNREFRISGRPTHTCVEGIGMRGLHNIAFLEGLYCDGEFHDDCDRACRLFWHIDWLSTEPPERPADAYVSMTEVLERLGPVAHGREYRCQSTELRGATTSYTPIEQSFSTRFLAYVHQVRDGELTVGEFVQRAGMSIYDRVAPLFGLKPSYQVRGIGAKTEATRLDLQPGEWVRVKSRKQIEATLDVNGKNKGLAFNSRMLAHCGRNYRVSSRLDKIIHEESGQMIPLKHTVILEGVQCRAEYCPRANYFFWREAWLERVEPQPDE